MKKFLSSPIAAMLALVVGCSDDAGGGNAPPLGRGTPACNQWQSAVCGLAERCQVPDPAAMCDQVKAIACKSDAVALACADALTSATCSAFPPNCDLRDMADPAPAIKACEDWGATVCQWYEQCQPGSREACLQQVESLSCRDFIGVTLAYEQCMTEIPTTPCTNQSGPEVCKGVLLK